MRAGGVLGSFVLACGVVVVAAPTASGAPACTPWTVSTVASGFGPLENLAFDDAGSMYLSETDPLGTGRIVALDPDGQRRTAVPDVASPGGLVVDGDTLYFATGNSPVSGILGRADGTIDTVDLGSGQREVYATGLVMPNGLAKTDDGRLWATRNVGVPSGVFSVAANAPHDVTPVRTDIGSSNGIAVDGTTVYVADTFEPELRITAFDADDPSGDTRTIAVDGFGPLTASDDMTIGPDGSIYLAQNLASRVMRIDPESGASCVIGTGMPLTTSVEFGGAQWDRDSIYATSFDGTVRKLTP